MKIQLDKSKYSTVGGSSCLVHVQWMIKAQSHQSGTVYLCLFKCMYSSCTQLCVFRVCVCGCGCGWMGGGGGRMGGGDLRPPGPVICKSHELLVVRLQTSRVQFVVYLSCSS